MVCGVSLPKSPTKLSAAIQFVVLKREDKWVVKAKGPGAPLFN
jgi:hypothetical protein